jgi:hypothetical protein
MPKTVRRASTARPTRAAPKKVQAAAPSRPKVVAAVPHVPHVPQFEGIVCRSCGIRPGRPTAIIGQLTATELCDVCAQLRKERIRQNRAMARGYRI